MTDTRIPGYESDSSLPNPAGMARVPRPYAHSNATRLLSAGAYLEKDFRTGVIRELVRDFYRVVAPSYGYDAVTVLAHALAARSLRRKQLAGVFLGELLTLILASKGLLPGVSAVLIALWLPWAFSFLRRVATMQALITWLSPRPSPSTSGAADYEYDFPADRALTPELVEKIALQQAGGQQEIMFARERFRPFVGAGWDKDDWTAAALLLPMKTDPTLRAYLRDEEDEEEEIEQPPVIPFTVEEISEYVAQRLESELRDDAPYGEQIENLVVERRRYSRAGSLPAKKRLFWRWRGVLLLPPSTVGEIGSFRPFEDREQYDAAREYLCIRVGAWDQEVVNSIFVGFDVRGNTLYSEFYPHVMPPVQASFHLVDRLPQRLGVKLLLRIAIDIPLSLPRQIYNTFWAALRAAWAQIRRLGRAAIGFVGVIDGSDLRLGRYAVDLVDTGAKVSLRELAASPDYHHFFQKADHTKYVQIVQRRLLEVMRDFLIEHNIDVFDHDQRGTTILDKSTRNYGDAIIHGNGVINQGGRGNRQSFGRGRGA
ncbi:hypothetical protein KDK95_17410 [Actinospica sp. MGRD01-02]|uniref:Uncharacterized protein n=1 Tax=Actinospica acidithermotolerans TaxID=2828514 RepID=A0A941EFG0_9ACTN|nr:hypothetical protein [Actinospica acidithermotolerans]MBR7828099.1 hypothetical protein [Actinospica acidithermotolerans]